MVIPCFEQGKNNLHILRVTEMGFGLTHSSINFPSDDVKLKVERSTRGQGKSHV